jgi:hypothetical protein
MAEWVQHRSRLAHFLVLINPAPSLFCAYVQLSGFQETPAQNHTPVSDEQTNCWMGAIPKGNLWTVVRNCLEATTAGLVFTTNSQFRSCWMRK